MFLEINIDFFCFDFVHKKRLKAHYMVFLSEIFGASFMEKTNWIEFQISEGSEWNRFVVDFLAVYREIMLDYPGK